MNECMHERMTKIERRSPSLPNIDLITQKKIAETKTKRDKKRKKSNTNYLMKTPQMKESQAIFVFFL